MPAYSVNGNPVNNWVRQFELFDEIYTLSDFATESIRRVYEGKVNTLPIQMLESANGFKGDPALAKTVKVNILKFTHTDYEMDSLENEATPMLSLKRGYVRRINPYIPQKISKAIRAIYRAAFIRQNPKLLINEIETELFRINLEDFCRDRIIISSWLNPFDSRKNFVDLLEAAGEFMMSNSSAVLLLKLHCSQDVGQVLVDEKIKQAANKFDVPISSFGFIFEYLDQNQAQLVRSKADLYLNTSSGEGLCWPVIEHLAMGVTAVVPNNTIFLEYFESGLIFKFSCDKVPAKFPINRLDKFDTYTFPPIRHSLSKKLLDGFLSTKTTPNFGKENRILSDFLLFKYQDGYLYELLK